MDSNPQPWPPYSKDCSQGICSYYCPQWCFFLFPPPPPSPPSSHVPLSPLLIAVIAVVSTVLVLVAYYLILAHYRRTRGRGRSSVLTAALPDNQHWHGTRRDGLVESLIEKIAACQYRAGGGLIVDGTDCSVCLSQFEDGDRIRLLPKCNHPFHLGCIDTWLKSHSTCPLCRAGIFPLPTPPPNNTSMNTTTAAIVEENEESQSTASTVNVSHDVIEIGQGSGVIGRSLSMDSPFRRRVELNSNSGTNTETGTGTGTWSRALHSIMISPVRMKRSRSLTSILPT